MRGFAIVAFNPLLPHARVPAHNDVDLADPLCGKQSGICRVLRVPTRCAAPSAGYKPCADVRPDTTVAQRAITAMVWHRSSSWAPHALLCLAFVLSAVPVSLSIGSASTTPLTDPPRKSNGFTDVVQWDNYSLLVNDQRIFLQYVGSSYQNHNPSKNLCFSSGEFHTFRLPVPDLWLDIFQKMVAAGFNGVRYVSPSSTLKPILTQVRPQHIYPQ